MTGRRRRHSSHSPFGVPTLPRVGRVDDVETSSVVEDIDPLPPPPLMEEPVDGQLHLAPPTPRHENLVANRYEILDRIGTGGMGAVFKVRHVELGKIFALKIIHSEMSENARVREMFYAEARLASSLEHRNIVSITDFGEDLRRGAFIVMEFLKGESLADRLDRERHVDIKTVCDIVSQTADALAYMHESGIIHGDIKPENIFLARSPEEDDRRRNLVKVLDFGLSRMKQHYRADRSEQLAGTPAYLAPERIMGAPPDEHSDLYSLGVLFYEMLTGRLPFDGNVAQILSAHLNEPPTPPSFLLPGQGLDERVDDIILTCMAKEPAARYQRVADFRDVLHAYMADLGIFRRRMPTPLVPPVHKPRDESCRNMVEGNPLPMFAVNEDGEITLANRSFAMFVKDDASRLVGKKLLQTRLGRFCPGLVEDLEFVLAHNKITSRELEFAHSDGTRNTLLVWLAPLVVGGIIVGAHGVVHWVLKEP